MEEPPPWKRRRKGVLQVKQEPGAAKPLSVEKSQSENTTEDNVSCLIRIASFDSSFDSSFGFQTKSIFGKHVLIERYSTLPQHRSETQRLSPLKPLRATATTSIKKPSGCSGCRPGGGQQSFLVSDVFLWVHKHILYDTDLGLIVCLTSRTDSQATLLFM